METEGTLKKQAAPHALHARLPLPNQIARRHPPPHLPYTHNFRVDATTPPALRQPVIPPPATQHAPPPHLLRIRHDGGAIAQELLQEHEVGVVLPPPKHVPLVHVL